MPMHDYISFYIHFPFCVQKCRYCDFYSISDTSGSIDLYIDALKNEWELTAAKHHLENTSIKTIYCGGGTPSLLSIKQWQSFCSQVIETLTIAEDAEWTIECNPDSFTEQKAEAWLESGVNRITIGVQSLNNHELTTLGRAHTEEDSIEVLANPILKRFASVGADIMYGLPGQDLDSHANTLRQIFSHNVITHLSAYELTIEDNTPFGKHRKLLPLPPEDSVAEMTQLILSESRRHGFEQYEISNYSKPGFECKHNLAYWDHSPYIGLGASAHSFINRQRYSNIKDVETYIQKLSTENLPIDFIENIDKETLAHEIIFLSLRKRAGLDENYFYEFTRKRFCSGKREKVLADLIKAKYLENNPPYWRLTDKGILIADAVARKLI